MEVVEISRVLITEEFGVIVSIIINLLLFGVLFHKDFSSEQITVAQYTQRLQKLIYQYLSADCFMKMSLQLQFYSLQTCTYAVWNAPARLTRDG